MHGLTLPNFYRARRPPFSVAAALRPPIDPVLALGKIAVSFFTPLCPWFIIYCPKSLEPWTLANSSHGAAVVILCAGNPQSPI